MKHILLSVLLLGSLSAIAQVGINTTSPDSTALLDVHYMKGEKAVGMLLPNLNKQERDDKIGHVSDGMLVFDRYEKLLYYYDGNINEWVALSPFGNKSKTSPNGLEDIRPQNDSVNKFLNMSLGLDTDEPATAKLDVNGDIRTRENLLVDKLATIPTLKVSSTATLQNLRVDGGTTLNSTLIVNGNISASNSTVTANTFVGYGITPVGGIMMWSGSTDDFDASGNGIVNTKMDGWALCYGQFVNNMQIPNLKGRFIAGYDPDDGDYTPIRKVAGAKEVTLSISQMPSHTHTITGYIGNDGVDGSGNANGHEGTNVVMTSDATGGSQAHENRPPYYVLAFIMRIK